MIRAGASELSRQIASQQASSVETVTAFLDAIAAANPMLNAIVTLDAERALQRAQEADQALASGLCWGPLHGVPFTVKDAVASAGLRTTSGAPALAEYVPEHDATVLARLRAAGGILLGKTNLPPFSGGERTDNPLFGRTSNPFDPRHGPGGSSGGSAAAVAAGLTGFDIGSDAAGSVRLPAHYCGVFGLKPSVGLVPLTGHVPPAMPGGSAGGSLCVATFGPLVRQAEDLDLLLRVLSGPDRDEPFGFNYVPGPATETVPGSLRLLLQPAHPEAPVCAETARLFENLLADLRHAGHEVVVTDLADLRPLEMMELTVQLFAAESTPVMPPAYVSMMKVALAEATDPTDVAMRGAFDATLEDYHRYRARRRHWAATLEAHLGGFDALLCPVSITAAPRHDEPLRRDGQAVPDWHVAAYLAAFSLTGHPAVSMPLGLTRGGLPIGVQVVGHLRDDAALCQVVCRLEADLGGYVPPPESDPMR